VSLDYAAELGFVAAMVALIFIDFDHQILPNGITLPGMALGLALAGPRVDVSFLNALLGALLGAGLLFLVSEVYFRLRKVEGLGMGDVKMMGMVGAFVGWKGVLLTLFLGSLSGTLVGLVVMAASKGDLRTKLPFGTFLGMGGIATVYLGERLIGWYTSLY
jgi:leader peptidase (prepilin peptidase)/N-methyltransferase